MQALKPADTEASTDMVELLARAEAALEADDAQACLALVEPLQNRSERARGLLARALEKLSEQCEAAGAHADALLHYRRFHRLAVDELLQRLARGEPQTDDGPRDALTGLPGAEALALRVPAMMAQALASKRGLCLVRIELDPLQPGRLAMQPQLPERVLAEIGALLRAHSRAKDLALRHVGEALVLVLSDVELSSARLVCERIRRAAQGHDWAALHAELRVSLSMGLTALRSGDDLKQLLARAEAGLVSARRDGRNCVRTGVISA
jgi:diguanylate cyclase (GGDEF)-like protein